MHHSHTGRLQMGIRNDAEGAARVILLHSRTEVRDNIAARPILTMDATMPVAVVRHYLPRLNVLAEVRAAAPHMKVRQITGGWGKTSLVPSDKATSEENRRRTNLGTELADFVRLNSSGNALAITYQAIEPRFAAEGIRTGHFNAIAGLDTYRDVRSLFVIGRPLPDARELRAAALALTGRPIPAESGQVETRGALMADGTGQAVNARVYVDPDLEALRVAITDREVLQAIGRGRGVNRDAGSPLDVFVLADVVLPLPVTTLARWEDIRPSVLARMLGRGCLLWSPSDAHKAYADLFPTEKSARHAIERAGKDFRPIPLRESFLGEWGGNSPVQVSYRPTGRGQQTRQALALPARLPVLREWLEVLVGPLAHYGIGGTAPPPPPSPRPTVAGDPLDAEVPVAEPPTDDAGYQYGNDSPAPPPGWADEMVPLDAYATDLVDEEDDWRSEFQAGEELGLSPSVDAAPEAWPLALTGRPIPAENGQVETRGALRADGTGAAVNVRAYAHPDLEALRSGSVVWPAPLMTNGRSSQCLRGQARQGLTMNDRRG